MNYRGLDVYSMGPPSSGGSTVGEALNILEGYNLASMPRDQAFHYFLEASRYCVRRPERLPRRPRLLRRAAERPALEGLRGHAARADHDDRGVVARRAGQPVPVRDRSGFSDRDAVGDDHAPRDVGQVGNVVSYTFTIESTGGSGLVVPGWGFLLNNELTDFNYDSTTHPNRADGGKRPRSSMAPTIVLRNGKPFLALGSPGGSTIITTVLQILFDRVDEGMTLPQAIADPRASQRNATTTSAEPAFLSSPLRTQLEARGHPFSNGGEIGAATGIEFLAGGNVLAAAEPVRRGGGSALVENPAP